MSTVATPSTTTAAPQRQSLVDRLLHGNRNGEPFLRQPQRTFWYAVLFVAIIIGSWAFWQRLSIGLAATDLTSQMPWGAWVAFYIYFVGLSAGAFLLSSLVYVFGMQQFERIGRMALLSAIVSMGVALAFIGADLGRLERAPTTVAWFSWTSPLSWEVRFYTLYIALLIAELTVALRLHLGKVASVARAHLWMRILGTVGVPLAIFGVHGGTGTIFAVVKARGMWAGGLFPVIFVVSAIVSGTALLTLIYFWQRRGVRRRPDKKLLNALGVVLAGALGIDLGLTFYEFIVPLLSFEHHETSVISVMVTGPLWWSFWIVQLLLGMIVPFIILVTPLRQRTGWMITAAAMVVVGILAVRFNIVVPPLITPVIEGYPVNNYVPTLTEWGLAVFFIAGGALVYSLISELLPIHEPTEEEAVHEPPTGPTESTDGTTPERVTA